MERTKVDLTKIHNIHLLGIGGAGMSGLALLFSQLGFSVSGCDMGRTRYIERLEKAGVTVVYGHDQNHLEQFDVDLVAYSSAISTANSELKKAMDSGIPVLKRAELLSLLFDSRCGIGIAGTHGKTTTTSLISYILDRAGLKPTIAVGGELRDIGCNARLGEGRFMVAELDESDGSFEYFHPDYTVVTNIDWDHVNHYHSIDDVDEAFKRFLKNNKPGGPLFLCGDDDGIRRVLPSLDSELRKRVVLFGRDPSFEYYASDISYHCGGGLSYKLHAHGEEIGTIDLVISGEHNVLDSMAACAVALELKIPFEVIKSTMRMFHGAERRLQMRSMCPDNILVYDDYGHHPREIEATLNALGQMYPDRRVVMVFQPHRYTRTQALFDYFASVLSTAGWVVLLPIYAADEQPIPGVTSEIISSDVDSRGGRCTPVANKVEAVNKVLDILRPGDLLLTEGAGDVCVVGDMVMAELNRQA